MAGRWDFVRDRAEHPRDERADQPGGASVRRTGDTAATAGAAAQAVRAGSSLSSEMVLALQRTIGNAAVVRLLEQQRLAGGVSRGQQNPESDQASTPPAVQRSTVPDVLRSPGRALAEPVRTEMEARLGADFTDVRLHDDAAAARSAAEIGARAYTSGNHVVLGAGGADKHTLAHELTHVIQQRRGPVAGTDDGGGLRVSDPGDHDERAAEANAARVMAGALPAPAPVADETGSAAHPAASSGGVGPVQRAVGFEFELGDVELYARKSAKSARERLKKGQVIARGEGFDVTADDPPTGSGANAMSDLEIIIHHLDDNQADNRAIMEQTLQRVVTLLTRLEDKAETEIPASDLGVPGNSFFLKPADTGLSGQLQATAGLALGALAAIRSGETYAAREREQDELSATSGAHAPETMAGAWALLHLREAGRSALLFRQCSNWAMLNLELSEPEARLVGTILSLLVEVPYNARATALPYPKAAAGGLMARTDFGSIMGLLPTELLVKVARGGGIGPTALDVLNVLLKSQDRPTANSGDPVFPTDFSTSGIARPKITIGEWFGGLDLRPSKDYLTKDTYQTKNANFLTKGRQAAALESMGALGSKMDPGYGAGAARPILEFRTLGRVLVPKLPVVGLGLWDYVVSAHS